MQSRIFLLSAVLILRLTMLAQDSAPNPPVPEPYNVAEAYDVYAAVLPGEWSWKDAHSPALLIGLETVTYVMCIRPDKESEEVLGPVIANFKEMNNKTWLLQRNFKIEKPYELVPHKEINQVLQSDAFQDGKAVVGTTPGDKHPKYLGYLELSAVGFNPDKTVAIVYIGHDCGWLCGGGGFHILQKKDGMWQPLKWKGSTCRWDS